MPERQISTSELSVSTINTIHTPDERPTWASPIHQGIEDATRSSRRRRSLECGATIVTIPEAELWNVKRRYTDFHFLDQQLKKIIPKEEMPVVPPKRFIGSSTDKRFVEERRRDLEKWLQILVVVPSAWVRTEFVRFLDNESNSMMFIWNFEKMRKVQETLSTMTLENKQETAKLTNDLITARNQVSTLQDRIARMEMIFLQQATGAAGEHNKLPSSAMHTLSRHDHHLVEASSYVSETSSQQDLKSTPPLSPIDFGDSTGPSGIVDNEDDDREVDKIFFDVSAPLATTHKSAASADADARHASASPMKPEEVFKVLAMTREQPITSQSLAVGGIHRSHSAQEFRSISASLLLQDAMRISNQMLEEKYVITNDSVGDAVQSESEAPQQMRTTLHIDEDGNEDCVSAEVDEPSLNGDSVADDRAPCADIGEDQSASMDLLYEKAVVSNNESVGESIVFQSKWMDVLCGRIDELMGAIMPTPSDIILRRRIFQYVQGVINVTLGGTQLFPMGSFVSSTFLPDGDVDLTAFMANDEKDDDPWFVKVNESLCFTSMGRGDTDGIRSTDKMNISNVSFVNAEVKIIKCMINNVNVDISVNRISAIYSQAMIEELDKYVGHNHLFKRSVLLIKAWCYYESPRHSKGSGGICGAREGGLKTWGLVTMIIWIFNHKGYHISHPIQALGHFLGYFASFQWTKYAITVFGPVAVADLSELTSAEFAAANYRRDYHCMALGSTSEPNTASSVHDSFFPDEELNRYKIRYENSRSTSYDCFLGVDNFIPKTTTEGVGGSTTGTGSDAAVLLEGAEAAAPQYSRANKKKAKQSTVWPAAAAFGGDSGDIYKRSVVNIIDCIQVKNNLGRSVSVMNYNSLVTVLQQGYQAFQDMCQGSQAFALSCGDVSSHSSNADVPIVTQFFLNTTTMLREFGRGSSVHQDSAATSTVHEDVLASQLDVLEVAMRHGEFILSSAVHYEELIRAVVGILQKRGPMPVGEIGKGLQELTCCDSISRRIKVLCGGLKKAIELHGVGQVEIGTDHPFNPCVYAVEDADEFFTNAPQGHERTTEVSSTSLSTSLTLSSMVLSPPRLDTRFTPLATTGKASSFKESNKNKMNDGFTPLMKSHSFKEKRNGHVNMSDGNGEHNGMSGSRTSQLSQRNAKKNSQGRNQGQNGSYGYGGYGQQPQPGNNNNGVALDQFGNPMMSNMVRPYWPDASAGGVYMMYPNRSGQGQPLSQQQIAQMCQQQQLYFQQTQQGQPATQPVAIPTDSAACVSEAFPPLPSPTH